MAMQHHHPVTAKAPGASRKARREPAPCPQSAPGQASERHEHVWRGASGRTYRHWVFPLLWCPELPAANYVLVRRHGDGRRSPLAIGHTRSEAESLNLAELRHRGALLEANEVHIHMGAADAETRAAIARDLAAAHAH